MQIDLTEEQKLLRDTCRDFADRELRPKQLSESCRANVTRPHRSKQILVVSDIEGFGELGDIDLAQAEAPPFALEYDSALTDM